MSARICRRADKGIHPAASQKAHRCPDKELTGELVLNRVIAMLSPWEVMKQASAAREKFGIYKLL
jgi:hypothetical protein